MIRRTITPWLTLVLCALLANAPVAQGDGDFEQEYRVSKGQMIELDMKEGGSLFVEGWDRDRVRIVCDVNINDIQDYDIEVKETSSGLEFTAELNDRSINNSDLDVRLMVPHEFDIETHSAGGGISIEGVTGSFKGRTGGGGITLRNVSGKARLTTGGGRIEILDSDLDGKVTTGGGGALVKNVTGDVEAKSGGGIVSYENVRDRDGDLRGPGRIDAEGLSTDTIMHTTAGGGIDLDEAPAGAIVRTGGGDIEIRDASRLVDATTGGGDIEIEITDGWVEARTGAGDIEVIVRDGLGDSSKGVDLSTGYGEVTVTLPADASVEFDLDLMYTRNSSREYDIDSDFDLDIEETKDWDSRQGSPRKHIYGTASVNGGRHKVKINNVNGNIRIIER